MNKNNEESTKKENSQSKKQLDQSHTSQLILSIVLVIIISLFIVSFFSFSLKIEYDNDNLWNVLWNYFNTDVFKTLLLSIVIPLFLSFWDSYKKKRDKQIDIEEKKIEIEENQRKERLAKIVE